MKSWYYQGWRRDVVAANLCIQTFKFQIVDEWQNCVGRPVVMKFSVKKNDSAICSSWSPGENEFYTKNLSQIQLAQKKQSNAKIRRT